MPGWSTVQLLMTLSRSREFEADRSGAELIGTVELPPRALEKLEAYAQRVPMDVPTARAFIGNPLTGREMNFASLICTHPTTAGRVAGLRGQR